MKKLKETIKLILSNYYIRRTRRILGKYWYRIISSTYLLSVPASLLNPFTFMREQRAVMAGKASYYAELTRHQNKSMVGLRRNIHRLEKALIMKPRRSVFAKDYIIETVEWYIAVVEKVKSGSKHDDSELIWAYSVLSEYFKIVDTRDEPFKAAKDLFESSEYKPKDDTQKPYIQPKAKNLPTYEQLVSLSENRRSVRWFKDKMVPRKIIDDALKVARQSPTACNRLPYEFRIFDDPELVKKISNTPFGTGGYADNIPVIAVVVGKLDSYFSARDRHAIYIDSSLAVMSFVYALQVQGVSTCLINWPDFEPLELKMQNLLQLDINERPIMLVAIGYADKDPVPRSTKKEIDTIRRFNFE